MVLQILWPEEPQKMEVMTELWCGSTASDLLADFSTTRHPGREVHGHQRAHGQHGVSG